MSTPSIDDVIVRGVLSVIETNPQWIGTMTNLSTTLVRVLSKRQREMLPATPSALGSVVSRVANRLRARGVSVRRGITGHSRVRFVKFSR